MDEKIDILDERGRPTGKVAWKSEAHRCGLWHRCFHCWISGSDFDGPYILVQRRARSKDTWPDYLDVSAAGHLAAGEDVMDGLRELEEELGLRPEPERLIALGTRRIEQEISGGLDREFHEVFLLVDSTPPGGFRLQREEVASVIRLSLDDAEKVSDGEPASAVEWTDGGPFSTKVSLADFVPNEEGYLRRVARAARNALAGRGSGRVFRL